MPDPAASIDRKKLLAFVQPLYRDLDGVSRLGDVERISAIARRLYSPSGAEEQRQFELLLLFQRLGPWLRRVGNLSRTALALGGDATEREIRSVSETLRRLDDPDSEPARALAAAQLVDASGVRALAERMAHARKEGMDVLEVVRGALAEPREVPGWLPPRASGWIVRRREIRDSLCSAVLGEEELEDL